MKCQAVTVKLNCGCCDETRLECELQEGHTPPQHAQFIDTYNKGQPVRYQVVWSEITIDS